MIDKTAPAMSEPKPIIMHTSIFQYLRKYTRTLHPLRRYVVLAFDFELSVNLRNNLKPKGDDKTFPERCILFNLRFINKNKHIFIGSVHYFEEASLRTVSHTIKAFIDDLFTCDLKVLATVSSGKIDMLSIIKELDPVKTRDGFLVYRVGQCGEIIHLFDPPYLLRQVHHIFQYNNILFDYNDECKIASYDDCNKLIKSSVVGPSFYESISNVSKVTSAAKTLSYTVGSMLLELTTTTDERKRIKTNFNGTSTFCHFFDQLFDTFNTTPSEMKKMYRKPCTNYSYHSTFWNNAAVILESMHPEFEYITIEPNKLDSQLSLREKIDKFINNIQRNVTNEANDNMEICTDLKDNKIMETKPAANANLEKVIPNSSSSENIARDESMQCPNIKNVKSENNSMIKELIDDNKKIPKKQSNSKGDEKNPKQSQMELNIKAENVDDLLNFALLNNMSTKCKLTLATTPDDTTQIEAEVSYELKPNPDAKQKSKEPTLTIIKDSSYESTPLECFIKIFMSIEHCLDKFLHVCHAEMDRLKKLVSLVLQDAMKVLKGNKPGHYMKHITSDVQILALIQSKFVPITHILDACTLDRAFAKETAIEVEKMIKSALNINNRPKCAMVKTRIPYILKEKSNGTSAVHPQMELFEMWKLTVCGMNALLKKLNELRIHELHTKYINCDVITDQIYRLQKEFTSNAEQIVAAPKSEVLNVAISALALSAYGNFTVR